MEWTKIENFLPYIMNEVHPCPEHMAKDYLRHALSEFCSESWAWTMWTDKETVKAGESEIYVDVPNQSTPAGLLDVEKDDAKWTLNSLRLEYDRVFMEEALKQDAIFRFRLALKPIREAVAVPTWIYEDFAETVASGAKYKIFSMFSQPWQNGEASMFHYQQFRKGISQAGSRKREKGNTRKTRRIQPKRFGF